jgi:hypothetical protein
VQVARAKAAELELLAARGREIVASRGVKRARAGGDEAGEGGVAAAAAADATAAAAPTRRRDPEAFVAAFAALPLRSLPPAEGSRRVRALVEAHLSGN